MEILYFIQAEVSAAENYFTKFMQDPLPVRTGMGGPERTSFVD